MPRILSLLLLGNFLLSVGCSHGPQVNVGVSNPALNEFQMSNPKGKTIAPVLYKDTQDWWVYPPLSDQALFDYCAARKDPTTQAPSFDACRSDVDKGTFDCQSYDCKIIPEGQGIACVPGDAYAVPFENSDNFVGFNQADNATLLSFCNVTL